jgi:hypothetical protein
MPPHTDSNLFSSHSQRRGALSLLDQRERIQQPEQRKSTFHKYKFILFQQAGIKNQGTPPGYLLGLSCRISTSTAITSSTLL